MGLFGKKKDNIPEDRSEAICGGTYMTGLPLPESVRCAISLYPNRLEITQDQSKFKIPIERVQNILIKDAVEIQDLYVSSIGGAIGGALLFGSLAAMIGGRAKNKTIKTKLI